MKPPATSRFCSGEEGLAKDAAWRREETKRPSSEGRIDLSRVGDMVPAAAEKKTSERRRKAWGDEEVKMQLNQARLTSWSSRSYAYPR